jgi:hypothetical protein
MVSAMAVINRCRTGPIPATDSSKRREADCDSDEVGFGWVMRFPPARAGRAIIHFWEALFIERFVSKAWKVLLL